MSGNQNGTVSVWDRLASPLPQLNSDPVLPPLLTFEAHSETVNGLRLATRPFNCLFSQLTRVYFQWPFDICLIDKIL